MIKRICLTVVLLSSLPIMAQTPPHFCDQLESLNILIANYHYNPKPLNDSLSSGVYKLFIKRLDEDKVIFTDQDLAIFRADSLKLDDYIRSKDCNFIEKYIKTFRIRIAEAKQVIDSYRGSEFDYSGVDSLTYYRTKESGYFDDEDARSKYWSKRIRFEVLSKLVEDDTLLSRIEQNFTQLEKDALPLVFEKLQCQLDEIENSEGGLERFVTETFLNSFTNYHDPNSVYFNNADKSMFENSVSTTTMSFGLYTEKNEEGEIEIAYITPGGAAQFDGTLEEGDVIRSLSSGTSVVETNCISNEEIVAFLSDNNHNRVIFRVRKKDGSILSVPLSKKADKPMENLTRGYVMSKDFPVGYISIPSFYTNFESVHGMGVANDVAKEIYKLKKEDIQGLIIDLRFNGGGSMMEATDLCGMFIDRGPVSILKYRNGETFTVKDANRGTLFNKPVVIIVNSYSASASEFFSSLMQDYNRAVIVGTPTYGKSSMQTIVALDETNAEFGFCKLTTDLFYRVTGRSNQSKGVIPDILFPSMYNGLEVTEEFLDFALPNDSITVTVAHKPGKKLPLASLRQYSDQRMQKDEGFRKIRELNETLLRSYIKRDTVYSLTARNVFGDLNGYNSLWKDFTDYFEKRKAILSVRNTASTEAIIEHNKDEQQLNAFSMDDIGNDLFIEEAYNIIADLRKFN